MDVLYEDRKLHNDGIFDSLAGYKEWFHYLGTFYVDGELLTFMLGFPRSYTGMGAFGWIFYKGQQYSLAGNLKDKNHDGFYELQRIPIHFEPSKKGYTLSYTTDPALKSNLYSGTVKGEFPDYTFEIKTPQLEIEINMQINSPSESVFKKEVFSSMPFGKRLASWFHSGDVKASVKGTIEGVNIHSTDAMNRGWYERMWSKVIVLVPSEWLWFMAHLDNGAVFDLYTAATLGVRVHPLDECWLYHEGIFHEFPHYEAHLPDHLGEAIRRKEYSSITGECITCEGRNLEDSFTIKATITDFRQYEFRDCTANIKYTNFIFDTEGEACIKGVNFDLKGRGAAERAPILYWWL